MKMTALLSLILLSLASPVQARDSDVRAQATDAMNSPDNTLFYHDGVFQPGAARAAVKAMLRRFGEPVLPRDEQIWVSDFGLGDYAHVGLASVTWINDAEHGYFDMTMYLLTGQMIPEHIHRPITEPPAKPAKHESWRVLRGWVYNFSEVGPASADQPRLPASFGPVHSHNVTVLHAGEAASLRRTQTWHFMKAGPEGAMVDEFGVFHDRRGWFSSNPRARPTDTPAADPQNARAGQGEATWR